MSERISREELVRIYQIEVSFFDQLEESGLLRTETADNVKYLTEENLPALERYANLYYDLDINIPGIEVIDRLMKKIETLQQENRNMFARLAQLHADWEDADFL